MQLTLQSMGLKKNFIYSATLTSANYVFPLIVWPYVSRVLGPAGIGLVNFIDSIANYAILFSMLGLSIFGIREIAVTKGHRGKMSAAFRDMLALNAICTAVAVAAMAVATVFVDQLRENSEMMGVAICKVVFNLFLIEWFYKGLEDFKFITLRTLLVKCLFVAGVFIFVRHEGDFLQFYCVTVGAVALNALINTLYSRKFLTRPSMPLNPWRYLRPFFTLGVYAVLTSAYTTLNITFLGFISGDTEVGYYTTATKLFAILLSIYSAFTTVMMPRMSSLLSENRVDEFKEYIAKSQRLLLTLMLPIILLSEVYAPQVIRLIAGEGFEGAIVPMRIISPFLLLLGYEQILVIQTLMPMGKDRIVTRNSLMGAVTGIVLNILVVPHLAAVGSAIVWVSSEMVIFLLSYVAVVKLLGVRIDLVPLLKGIVMYFPCAAVCVLIGMVPEERLPYWAALLCGTAFTGVYFLVEEVWIKKDTMLRVMLGKLRGKRRRG